MHIALEPTEADAVRQFGSQVVPAENFEIHTELLEGGAEGDAILAIRVIAETAEEATGEAAWSLSKIRKAAGLTAASTQVLGYISPQWRKDAARHMGKEAVGLLRQGRDALAVIRAQTACELLIGKTFEDLLADKDPAVRSDHLIRRPATLADKTSLALLHLLTGRRIQDEPWWGSYVEHRKRRGPRAAGRPRPRGDRWRRPADPQGAAAILGRGDPGRQPLGDLPLFSFARGSTTGKGQCPGPYTRRTGSRGSGLIRCH